MRIAYIGHSRFPTEKAHGHQIAQVCDALTSLGHRVTLVIPTIRNPLKPDQSRTYYGLRAEITVEVLSHPDPWTWSVFPGRFKHHVTLLLYRRALARFLSNASFDLLYARSPLVLRPLLASGIPVVLELHELPRIGRASFVSHANRCAVVVALTRALRDRLIALGVRSDRCIVEGDGVDLRLFRSLPQASEAKRRFNLPDGCSIIAYVGRLNTVDQAKGVDELLEALRGLLRDSLPVHGFIVGGPKEDQEFYRKRSQALGIASQCTFAGPVPRTEVPAVLAACDVLAMPFPDTPHYRQNMSPLKMFEYMAAGKPIVTSDLPTVRDVLDERSAYFCVPGDARSLQEVLREVLEHPEEASARAKNALALSERYDWGKRMERILARVNVPR